MVSTTPSTDNLTIQLLRQMFTLALQGFGSINQQPHGGICCTDTQYNGDAGSSSHILRCAAYDGILFNHAMPMTLALHCVNNVGVRVLPRGVDLMHWAWVGFRESVQTEREAWRQRVLDWAWKLADLVCRVLITCFFENPTTWVYLLLLVIKVNFWWSQQSSERPSIACVVACNVWRLACTVTVGYYELQLVGHGYPATSLLVKLLLGRSSLSASSGTFLPVECLSRTLKCVWTACILSNVCELLLEWQLAYLLACTCLCTSRCLLCVWRPSGSIGKSKSS